MNVCQQEALTPELAKTYLYCLNLLCTRFNIHQPRISLSYQMTNQKFTLIYIEKDLCPFSNPDARYYRVYIGICYLFLVYMAFVFCL